MALKERPSLSAQSAIRACISLEIAVIFLSSLGTIYLFLTFALYKNVYYNTNVMNFGGNYESIW
jgi:hypothetical protein